MLSLNICTHFLKVGSFKSFSKCKFKLFLFEAWADAFKSQPDLQGVVQVYNDLKAKGVEFPAADLDSLAPIITPKRVRNFHLFLIFPFLHPFFRLFPLPCYANTFLSLSITYKDEILTILETGIQILKHSPKTPRVVCAECESLCL